MAVRPLVAEAMLTMVSRVQGRVRAASVWPAHRSTTGWLSMVTATAAPTSPCRSKLSANASRTGRNRASQRPAMTPLTTSPRLPSNGPLEVGGQCTTPGGGALAFAVGQRATGGLDEEALGPDDLVALAAQALGDLGRGRPGQPPGLGEAGVEGRSHGLAGREAFQPAAQALLAGQDRPILGVGGIPGDRLVGAWPGHAVAVGR